MTPVDDDGYDNDDDKRNYLCVKMNLKVKHREFFPYLQPLLTSWHRLAKSVCIFSAAQLGCQLVLAGSVMW